MPNSKVEAIWKELEDLNRAEKLELAGLLVHGVKDSSSGVRVVDLNQFAGTADIPVDGLQWQLAQRAEWDR
jgi:hypothetical protein